MLKVGTQQNVLVLYSESPEFVSILPWDQVAALDQMIPVCGELAAKVDFITTEPKIGQVTL